MKQAMSLMWIWMPDNEKRHADGLASNLVCGITDRRLHEAYDYRYRFKLYASYII